MLSTKSGVYTTAQASSGKDTFDARCSSCHTVVSLVGPDFKSEYGGHPLLMLYKYISKQMPQDNPGSLSADEYVKVMAYILQTAKMPAGATALPADTLGLSAIRYDSSASPMPRLRRR